MSQSERKVFELCDRVREVSLALHRYLRHGHMEKVYENSLAHRLRTAAQYSNSTRYTSWTKTEPLSAPTSPTYWSGTS